MCHLFMDNAKKGYVKVNNDSESIINLSKHSHVIDLRTCDKLELTSPKIGGFV